MQLASVVDLARYPIDRPASPGYGTLVDACRRELSERAVARLPGFLRADALPSLTAQSAAVADRGFANDALANVYFTEPDETLGDDHPNRTLVRSAQKAVAMDLLPSDFAGKVVYDAPELIRFASDVLELGPLHRSADPFDGCNMTVYEAGDELGWHFDNSEFSITLMIQPADRGGVFEYVPFTRTPTDECVDRVAAILAGDRTDVVAIDPQPGELSIFRGKYSLHRVSPVEGDTPRYNSVLTYATHPDHRLSPLTAELFYGRRADVV